MFTGVCKRATYFCNFAAFRTGMRKLITAIFLALVAALAVSAWSCTPQSCFEETESYLKVSFYDTIANKLHAPDSLTIYGLDLGTNKLYDNVKSVQPALIPLNATVPGCTFVFIINGVADTIGFSYSTFAHLISKECGYTYYHNLISDTLYTKKGIRNIYIANSAITTLKQENIRIYYFK